MLLLTIWIFNYQFYFVPLFSQEERTRNKMKLTCPAVAQKNYRQFLRNMKAIPKFKAVTYILFGWMNGWVGVFVLSCDITK